jgi:uncharacterized protein YndB with AHSA1/START domain
MIRELVLVALTGSLAVHSMMSDGQDALDGTEKTAPTQVPEPIDTSLFDAAGSSLRTLVKEARIEAPQQRVYDAWATSEGWQKLFGEPAKAEIELAIGGRYEWLFDGTNGSNGCQILSYIPGRMLSFTWNSPPSIPQTRDRRTWVVVEVEPIDETACTLRITHMGFGEGEAWDKTYAYFDAAWGSVMGYMSTKLAE